jgi:hypothetical protein
MDECGFFLSSLDPHAMIISLIGVVCQEDIGLIDVISSVLLHLLTLFHPKLSDFSLIKRKNRET